MTQKREGIPYVIASCVFLPSVNCTPAIIGPRHLKHSGFSNRIDKCPRMIQLNFSLEGGCTPSIRRVNRGHSLPFFVTSRCLRSRLANVEKKRRASHRFFRSVSFSNFQSGRIVLTDPLAIYWILKTPLRLTDLETDGLTPFLFLILCRTGESIVVSNLTISTSSDRWLNDRSYFHCNRISVQKWGKATVNRERRVRLP